MYLLRSLISNLILSVVVVALISFQTLALYYKSPNLLKERIKRATRGRGSLVQKGFGASVILQWIIAGLDQRFNWSDVVPTVWVVAGLVIFATGLCLFILSSLVNPFFSIVSRIQADRGQRVVNEGPYTVVRHPGYAGNLLAMVVGGIALNSLLSITPSVIAVVTTFRGTEIEDQMLRDELAGYADYAAKVRYRLIPGVW
jgi:protein-S-isoprenylcysteine O-methyltransferase Ste14